MLGVLPFGEDPKLRYPNSCHNDADYTNSSLLENLKNNDDIWDDNDRRI